MLLVGRAPLGKPAWPWGAVQVAPCISSLWLFLGYLCWDGLVWCLVAALGSATAVLVPSALCFAQTKMLQGCGCWYATVPGGCLYEGDGYAGRGQLRGRVHLSTWVSELSEGLYQILWKIFVP